MSKAVGSRLDCAAVFAGILVFFYCGPLWGYAPDFDKQRTPPLFAYQPEDLLSQYQWNHRNNVQLGKRGSKNRRFQQWQNLSPEEQEKMRRKYKEWQSLPPQEKQMMRQRMNNLNKMSPQEQKMYKQLYRQWQHMPPNERKQLEKDLENWENLSPQQQKSIRRRFRNH